MGLVIDFCVSNKSLDCAYLLLITWAMCYFTLLMLIIKIILCGHNNFIVINFEGFNNVIMDFTYNYNLNRPLNLNV
jgi:hypothetical protein